jgi:hypothetical protein
MLYSNIEKKEACRFFKWLDKPICARGMEVLAELTTKVKNLEDENDNYMAMIKDPRLLGMAEPPLRAMMVVRPPPDWP